jgi:dTDP-4-dehydrorhamnose 3,5-epimerase
MEITELSIAGSFAITNTVHTDGRGEFVELFRADHLKNVTGVDFSTIQANLSVSRKSTLRGIHFADVPPGQAKYVMCPTGAIQDYIVDIRVGSPTFGTWEAVTITAKDRNAVLLDIGLGHAFVALEEGTTVTYLVSDHYNPKIEHAVNAQDPDLGLEFPFSAQELLVSAKDRSAPSLHDAFSSGMLPTWAGR